MLRQGSERAAPAAASSDHGQTARLLSALQKQINDLARAPKPDNSARHAKAIQNAFTPVSEPAPPPAIKDGGRKGADAKAKATRRQKKGELKPPAALAGCATRSSVATGSAKMCYAFNLGTCYVKGDRCSNGEHLCMRKVNGEACSQKHPQSSCTRR